MYQKVDVRQVLNRMNTYQQMRHQGQWQMDDYVLNHIHMVERL
jgi:hypothetical protein